MPLDILSSMSDWVQPRGRADLPRLLVVTRFGVGVTDRAWLTHRLALISSITAPSLANQTEHGITWAIIIDDNLPHDIRGPLAALVAPFEDAHLVEAARYRYSTKGFQDLARDLGTLDSSGRMLTARLDDDDAWHRRTVEWIGRALASWTDKDDGSKAGVGFSFDRVIEWIMYDMLNVSRLQEGRYDTVLPAIHDVAQPFASMSVFVMSHVSSDVSARSVGHQFMHDWLVKHNYDVVVLSPGEPASLYCRHKQANTAMSKGHRDAMALDLDIASLAERFGIDAELTSAYVQDSRSVPYLLEARPNHRRRARAAILREIEAELDKAPAPETAARLRARRHVLAAEARRVTSSKVAAFPELLRMRGNTGPASETEQVAELRGILAERARAQAELEELLTAIELETGRRMAALDAQVRKLRRRAGRHDPLAPASSQPDAQVSD